MITAKEARKNTLAYIGQEIEDKSKTGQSHYDFYYSDSNDSIVGSEYIEYLKDCGFKIEAGQDTTVANGTVHFLRISW